MAGPATWLVGMAVLFLLASNDSVTDVMLPMFSFVKEGGDGTKHLLEKQINGIWQLYGYSERQIRDTMTEGQMPEHTLSLEEILLAEAQETENDLTAENKDENDNAGVNVESGDSEVADTASESLQDLLKAENDAAMALSIENPLFVQHTLQNPVNLQALSDYETLVKSFYTIDKNTMAGSDQLNVSKLLEEDLTISKEGEGPQILIYHTHSQETFSDSVPGDVSTSIVGVGEQLKEILEAQYGYKVLHHMGQYDVEARDDAYSKALPGIEQVLAENPSIQVVIDLHRDQMAEETRLVMDLDGRPTARFMFFNGLSRTKKTGNIAYLYNENQEENLAFSFQMQLKATEYYPGLVRKIYLKGYRYNMHLKPRTLLIELGAQNNTVEEAMNACDPIAHILDMVLSGSG